jgi:photosystem II stability/assembly factor-like uncharacterized protein
MVSAVPGSNNVIAGVARSGLWVNSSGSTWSLLGTGGSVPIPNRPSWIAYDPAHPGVFWESGIYGTGGGVFKTIDNGNTFQQLGSISHNDYVSVDFSDPNRQTLLAGGHEQARTVYRSTNGGQVWTNVGMTLPENTKFSTIPLVLNSQTYLVNAQGYSGQIAGIFRTINGGASWQQVSALGPPVAPLMTFSGVIYWPFGGGLLKSTNAGLTWTQVGSGLREITPVELPDGTLVSVGSTTLVISADGGASWSPLGPAFPSWSWPGLASVTYSTNRQAFFISHWDCGTVVLSDAIMRLDHSLSTVPAPPGNLRILSSQ